MSDSKDLYLSENNSKELFYYRFKRFFQSVASFCSNCSRYSFENPKKIWVHPEWVTNTIAVVPDSPWERPFSATVFKSDFQVIQESYLLMRDGHWILHTYSLMLPKISVSVFVISLNFWKYFLRDLAWLLPHGFRVSHFSVPRGWGICTLKKLSRVWPGGR